MEENKNKETLKSEIAQGSRTYIMAGLGLVAGLAWNDAIKSLIDAVFTFSRTGIIAKFAYAVLITAVVVLIGNYVFRTKS